MRKSIIIAALAAAIATGCATSSGMPASGPSTRTFSAQSEETIRVVPLTVAVARAASAEGTIDFASLPSPSPINGQVSKGDQIEVSIWEAAPATLFGGGAEAISSGRTVVLPPQTVGIDGRITVPFAGRVIAAGRQTSEIEADISKALQGKANRAQVMVRNASNVSAEVTVIGQVRESRRLPLTARGERLLDAIASAGGSSVPVEKATVQVTRRGVTATSALQSIVTTPDQNIELSPTDIVAVYFQPKSFVALGAVNKVGEIDFEATGLSLSEAIARAGGAVDSRADAKGVFVARIVDGKPVVYQVNLRDPASLFAMREFEVQNDDIIYIANASGTELQKFLSLLGSAVYPIDALRTFGNGS